jgi:cytochrome c oxidase subunit III
MGIIHHLTRKPWLPEQREIDNLTTGGAISLPTPKVGLRVFLFPISALFVLFFIAYVMRMRFADWQTLHDPMVLWLNTGVLILSSLALQRARVSARQGNMPATRASLVVGGVFAFAFLGGQLVAWQQLAALGYFADTNPANAFFYLFTALHGLHLLGGLVAWGRTVLKIGRGAETDHVCLSTELCAVYWHYLLAVWAAMFSLLLAT